MLVESLDNLRESFGKFQNPQPEVRSHKLEGFPGEIILPRAS